MVERRNRRAKGQKGWLYQDYGIDMEVERRLRGLFLRGTGKVTPGDYQMGTVDCIRVASKKNTLKRLKTGLWFCCIKGGNDERFSGLYLLNLYLKKDNKACHIIKSIPQLGRFKDLHYFIKNGDDYVKEYTLQYYLTLIKDYFM